MILETCDDLCCYLWYFIVINRKDGVRLIAYDNNRVRVRVCVLVSGYLEDADDSFCSFQMLVKNVAEIFDPSLKL